MMTNSINKTIFLKWFKYTELPNHSLHRTWRDQRN